MLASLAANQAWGQWSSTNVGSPTLPGSVVPADDGFDLAGAGTDIAGSFDQFVFNYLSEAQAGDFDVKVRVPGLDPTDAWAKAGLMARESFVGGSRYAAAFATPGISGCFFQYRANTSGQTTNLGSAPVTYPNTWLRLKRAGKIFTGYSSLDGDAWTMLGSYSLTFSNNLYLGLGVTSHSTNKLATAHFRGFQAVTGGTIGSVVLTKEPLGPSSRKTGLVISEIMYHPKPVPGLSNSLEYIEIHNSQAFFEDIGNFRLSGSIDYTFPPKTVIPAGGFLVVAREPGAVQSHYGLSGVLGPWAGASTNSLPGGQGTIRLRNEAGAVLLEVNYEGKSPWPIAADGAGHSLVLARPSYGEGSVKAWDISERIGGSPGQPEPWDADPLRSVVINELLANSTPPLEDYLELYNHSNLEVDLSGAWLTDEAGTNKFRIPDATTIPARGYRAFTVNLETLGFALSHLGERVYLVNSNQTRVIDAVDFGPQEDGVSTGRCPDGSPSWYRLASRSPGQPNGALRQEPVIINEVMYAPITGDNDDEYVELYNRGSVPVNVGGWKFVAGITFTIPPNRVIPTNGYLVIAKNAARLLTNYSTLSTANTVGDYSGSLANSGERLALGKPEYTAVTNAQGVLTTNIDYIVVNEVAYSDGGRWGIWSDGGGSSLELKDPNSDNRQAANWDDSDETGKGIWTTIELTGTLGENLSASADELFVTLLGIGECLVDDAEVHTVTGTTTGPNLVNNPGFESGNNNWVFQGSHDQSTIENTGYSGTKSLHLRAAWRGDNGGNRVRTTSLNPIPTSGVTLRAKAKWLRGSPDLLLRLHGGGFEVGGRMRIQPNLGTPGARNSKAINNAGPAIYDVVHTPILPAAGEPVVVTARATDPNLPFTLTLKYRIDPATTFVSVPMADDGTDGDLIAGDGAYSATIPGQSAGVAAFYIEGKDAANAINRFPQSLFPAAPLTRCFPVDSPARECVVRWGERSMPGSFGEYHVWLTSANTAQWRNRRPVLDNTPNDATFVYNNYRVIYNAKTHYAGSPWHRGQMTTGPDGSSRTDYVVLFPEDNQFLGTTDAVWCTPGNPDSSNSSDASIQAEQASYLLFKGLGVHYNYRRYVHVFYNGVQRSISGSRPGNFLMEDAQQPNGDTIDEWCSNDTGGQLYKIEDWFEFPDNGDDFLTNNDADLTRRENTTNGVAAIHTGAYRFMWRKRSVGAGESANDYSSFFQMLNAVSPTKNTSAAVDFKSVDAVVDYEQWMRVMACQHAAGNWDSYGYDRGKNCYAYKPVNGKFALWTWDIDFTMGVGGNGTTQDIMQTPTDPRVLAMWNNPVIGRAYWRAYLDLINGPLNNSFMDPILDAKAAAMGANNINYDAGVVGTIKSFVTGRRAYIAGRLTALTNAPFSTSITNVTISSNYVVINGTAPVGIKTILINGIEYPITWSGTLAYGFTNWTLRFVVSQPVNQFIVRGYDAKGQPVASASRTVTVNYTGPVANPEGAVVFNEIMYRPKVAGAEFVELYNNSDFAFDLAGWRVNGLDYTFPEGALLAGRQHLVLAQNPAAFLSAYTNAPSPFAQYAGRLDPDGETLSLYRPATNAAREVLVCQVRYEARAPWLASAAGEGASLELIDPDQDIRRPSNWGDGSGWRFVSTNYTTGAQVITNAYLVLDGAGVVYLDELSLSATTGPLAGSNVLANGSFDAPLEGAWFFGTNCDQSVLSTEIKHDGPSGLRLVFTRSGILHNTRASMWQPVSVEANIVYNLSFWYLPTTNANKLTFRLNNAFHPEVFVKPPGAYTPGWANLTLAPLPAYDPVWLNEVRGAGEDGPGWVELYNAGANPVTLAGYYLADHYGTNLLQWAFPAGAVLAAGEFKLVRADGTGASTAADWRANFTLGVASGQVALVRQVGEAAQVTDYLTYTNLVAGAAYGDFPDGQCVSRRVFLAPTPGAANLTPPAGVVINEWMAANRRTIENPDDPGHFDDWFELYNAGTGPADLSDYNLSNNLTNRSNSRLPAGTVLPAGGYLLVWADGANNPAGLLGLHADFKLSAGGEAIGLFGPAGELVDGVRFGPQTNDVSQGRWPNGQPGANYAWFTNATPGAANVYLGPTLNRPPAISPIADPYLIAGQSLALALAASDPDAGQHLSWSLAGDPPAGLSVEPATGQLTWTPPANQAPGGYPVGVSVRDDGSPPLSASATFTVHVVAPPRAVLRPGGGGALALSFPTVAGKRYQVLYQDRLGQGPWLLWAEAVVGTGGELTVPLETGAAPQRFYKLQILE